MSDLSHEIATNEEIAEFCSAPTSNRVLFHIQGGATVVQISSHAVVKFGFHITEFEAQNQQMARNLLDSTVVYVPQVYRVFRFNGLGYIVMELIHGVTFEQAWSQHPDLLKTKLLNVMYHFNSIRSSKTGPLAGGPARGPLWAECGEFSPQDISAIERYLNRRLSKLNDPLSFGKYDLVFCHQDLAERNMLVLNDGSIAILDWEGAGFYPKVFEICGLRLNRRKENDLAGILLSSFLLNDTEEHDIDLILKAWANDQKYWM